MVVREPHAVTLIDEWMPAFDVASRHAIDVNASAARTYGVTRHVKMGATPLVRALMALRVIPGLVVLAASRHNRAASGAARLRGPGGIPFTLLSEEPGSEFVMGLAGRFWTPSGGVVHADADTFKSPPPAGLAHAVWNFRVEPLTSGCRVTTETRVRCADDATRAHFLRYWRVIRFGSALIRRSILREIRRQAERAERVNGGFRL